mmetsp:Transcript_9571/g.33024  ORF Transcript_9571/g.33024 Transcript_9571/m.33024 type:complete len:287 (-) Transcript_9571:84-944(-)
MLDLGHGGLDPEHQQRVAPLGPLLLFKTRPELGQVRQDGHGLGEVKGVDLWLLFGRGAGAGAGLHSLLRRGLAARHRSGLLLTPQRFQGLHLLALVLGDEGLHVLLQGLPRPLQQNLADDARVDPAAELRGELLGGASHLDVLGVEQLWDLPEQPFYVEGLGPVGTQGLREGLHTGESDLGDLVRQSVRHDSVDDQVAPTELREEKKALLRPLDGVRATAQALGTNPLAYRGAVARHEGILSRLGRPQRGAQGLEGRGLRRGVRVAHPYHEELGVFACVPGHQLAR